VQSAPGGASLSALKEGKSKNKHTCPCEIRYDAVPALRNGQLATVKQHPAAGDEGHLVCGQSAFRAIATVTQ